MCKFVRCTETWNYMQHYLKTLEEAFRNYWDRKSLCNYKGEELTYKDMAVNMAKIQLFFETIGVVKGDKVALSARNSARWGNTFLAINTYGTVVVPILNDFLPEAISKLADHSEAKVIFTDKEIWDKMDPSSMPMLKAALNNNDYTLMYASDDSVAAAYNNLNNAFNARYPLGYGRDNIHFTTDNSSDICVINYTSGTTSAPKGVMIRYECFSHMVDFSFTHLNASSQDSIVSLLPMGHIYGLMFEFLYPVCYGVTIYFLGKTPSPTLLMRAMGDVKPFLIAAVPLVMEKIYKSAIKPTFSKLGILMKLPLVGTAIYRNAGKKLRAAFGGNVRLIVLGGAALNPEVDKAFKRMRMPFTVGYGMTEASPLLTYEWWEKYLPGSCGKTVPGVEIKIDSDDQQHVAGEILARGMNICSGYFKNPEATANAFTDDGFFRTGDLGVFDRHGNLFIKGRCKNLILSSSGQNIYPEEIEAVLNSHPNVAESIALDRAGKIVALVYLDADKLKGLDDEAVSDIPENIRISSNRQLPPYSHIAKVEVMSEPFAKTPKMSIKRFLYK